MDKWWIKLHRKINCWEWYSDLPCRVLFIHLLLSVNIEDKVWKGVDVKRGQICTGRASLSRETGLSEQQLRTAIKKLESTGEITSKATNKYSLITVCNFDKYQGQQTDDNQHVNQQGNLQSTTTKEIKNKEERKGFVPPSLEDVINYCLERKNNVDSEKFTDHYTSNGWMVGKNKMKDWKAAVRTWEKSSPKPKGQKIGGLTFE